MVTHMHALGCPVTPMTEGLRYFEQPNPVRRRNANANSVGHLSKPLKHTDFGENSATFLKFNEISPHILDLLEFRVGMREL